MLPVDKTKDSFGKPSSPGPVCNHTLHSKTTRWSERVSEILQKSLWQAAGFKGPVPFFFLSFFFFLQLFLQVILFQEAREALPGKREVQEAVL